MIRRPPRSTRTDTLFPYTTLFRSAGDHLVGAVDSARLHLRPRLDPGTSLPLDDPRIAIGMDERSTALGEQLGGDRIARFGDAVIKHHLGAELARRRELHRRRVARHHDRRPDPQPLRRPCDPLRMIAARYT